MQIRHLPEYNLGIVLIRPCASASFRLPRRNVESLNILLHSFQQQLKSLKGVFFHGSRHITLPRGESHVSRSFLREFRSGSLKRGRFYLESRPLGVSLQVVSCLVLKPAMSYSDLDFYVVLTKEILISLFMFKKVTIVLAKSRVEHFSSKSC